ncbi:MAG TPA: ribonuclease HI family protein [Dehalococcoidia bacterium]|nr:ribonuclease HI family protein [Dehalococcoidia bacterium]
MNPKRVVIYSDGASSGNPGPAAIGAVLKDGQGKFLARISQRIGEATNNQAEYRAIIAALEKAIGLGAEEVDIKSDSELVVKQIQGSYRVKKATLRPLYQRVVQLIGSFATFSITHIPRQQNREADNLAKKALDLVAHLPPAEGYRLTVKLNQTSEEESDIAYLHKLIDTLRDFPGEDEVSLRVTNEENVIILRLPNIHVDYCLELRKRLVGIVGKKRLKVEPVD